MTKKYVTLCRVSTAKDVNGNGQGADGYGMESQRQTVREYVEQQNGVLVGHFEEVISGSKTESDRPELRQALELCKRTGATLVCKRLDRLGRNAGALITLLDSGVDLVFVDQPGLCKFSLSILSCVASHERNLISSRTKAGLKVARERLAMEGRRLGNPNGCEQVKLMNNVRKMKAMKFNHDIYAVIGDIKMSGVTTWSGISECLNRRGYTTRRGSRWYANTVQKVAAAVENA